jgi:hypothetical protein
VPDEYVYRVVLQDGCRRPRENGELRVGDPVWLTGSSAPGILWRVAEVLPSLTDGEEGTIVVELWTGEPPRLA